MASRCYYFWQNIPSPHQSGHLRALAQMGHEVHLVVDAMVDPSRQAMGWTPPDLTGVDVQVHRGPDSIPRLLESQPGDAVTIVSGFRGCQAAPLVTNFLISKNKPFVIMAEAADHTTWRLLPRLLYYGVKCRQLARHRILLLTMGELGVNWYARRGFPSDHICEFAYSVDSNDVLPVSSEEKPSTTPVRLAFVGSLYDLKRVDMLLRALQRVPGNWSLDVIGDGRDRSDLEQLANTLGVAQSVRFHGTLAHRTVLQQLRDCDALVLASRYDGWGAVVGEALCHGVRTIVADSCGSATLLRASARGFRFKSGNVAELAACLSSVVAEGPRTAAQRHELANWAHCLQGKSIARYLDNTVNWFLSERKSPKPVVPWLQRHEHNEIVLK